ncbi:MAG: serine hydrolase domain-containing protein [Acidimicrobiia bacterium]
MSDTSHYRVLHNAGEIGVAAKAGRTNVAMRPRLKQCHVALVIGCLAVATAAAAQQVDTSAIDAVFSKWDQADSPGVSVAVMRRGEIIFSRGYGSAQLEYEVPITPATVFHAASVSKQFTAMAIALLAAEGTLSLDDEIQTHLTYVPRFDQRVTVRQLIHHTSGIRDQWELLAMAGWRLDDVITMDHIRSMVRHQRELNFEPNSEHLYSNMGYTLLAEIVAAVSGQSFAEFTQTRIFEPLGMSETHFHDDHQMIVRHRAYSYTPGDAGGYRNAVLSFANAGATSLFTTAEDLVRWLDNFRHARVGGPAVIEQMQERAVLNDGDRISYAHGVMIGTYRGTNTVFHGGADAGFRSYIVWFEEPAVGIAVLTNFGSIQPQRLAHEVADVVMSDVFQEATVASSPREEERGRGARLPFAAFSDRELADYAGVYYSEGLGTFYTVEVEADTLVARHRRHGDIPLSYVEEDEFRGNRWFFHQVKFERKADLVTGLRVTGSRVRNLWFAKQ